MISALDGDDVDLRYLQSEDFQPGENVPWTWPQNPFEQRLATNLRPGLALVLDLDVVARVLGGAALAAPGHVVTVSLTLEPNCSHIEVMSFVREMLPIYADEAGNLKPALRWYQQHGEPSLRVSVMGPRYFWLPSVGTRGNG
jgi:hypothetical protein